MLALALAIVAIAQPAATMAQSTVQGQSQTIGSSTVTYGPNWQFDADISDATSVFLSHASLSGTLFIYGQIADAGVTDPALALEQFATGFFSQFGEKDEQLVTSGTLTSDPTTAWHLYSVTQSGIPYGMLITGNTTKVPGSVVTSVLLSPEGSFDLAIKAVQDEIDIDGAGSPFAEFDAAQISTTLEGGATTATTPAIGTTPAAGTTPATGTTPAGGLTLPPLTPATEPAIGTTPATGTTPVTGTTPAGGLTLPPLNPTTTPAAGTTPVTGTTPATGTTAGQSTTVAGATFTYNNRWIFDTANSEPDGRTFWDAADGSLTWFGYLPTSPEAGDAATALQSFNTRYFQNDFEGVQQVTLEAISPTSAWSLTTATLSGLPVVVLSYADTSHADQLRIQVLMSEQDKFQAALPDVQSSIQIDGAGVLAGVDPAAVTALLSGGAPPAVTPTTTASTTTGAVLSVTGDTSQYESRDAQGTCDAIGWAATGSDQIPATEQDINHRASCVGGGTFFAACGTAAPTDLGAPDPGMAWVQCDVTVRVDGAPMTLSMLDFELSDATGAVYSFDFLAALASIQSLQVFPEEPVATGQTATGSVLFSVPTTAAASGPWLLSVKPETLQTTGEQPGTIVISGDLQPFAAGQ
jgi:hypothetical protein